MAVMNGVFMIGLDGASLSSEERSLLAHPLVGGVVLFTRNYRDPKQLRGLADEVRAVDGSLQIAVDQESADVQRLREHFTALPKPAAIGHLYDRDREQGLRVARAFGRVVAHELRGVGVDFSFAPVLDLKTGKSGVIGERAFHADPRAVAALGRAFIEGLHDVGMMAVGKHFPGHGSAVGDTHDQVVRDGRGFDEIAASDLLPFKTLAAAGLLDAVMLSHVIYAAADAAPASLSSYWLRDVLRGQLGFRGLVFSDDLGMAGCAGLDAAALKRALDAGCDIALVCNDRGMARDLMAGFADREIEHYNSVAARHWSAARRALQDASRGMFDHGRDVSLLERRR